MVLAGLFCDVASKGIATLEDLKYLPKEIYDLITQIQLPSDDWSALPEKVLLIKLAERLNNMRIIEYMDEARISKKAEETLQLLKSLANRIENKEILEELNALGVRYLE